MYLYIVADKSGKFIAPVVAKSRINKLINNIQTEDELFLVISEELRQSLENYQENPNLENIQSVQNRIKSDFEESKCKLGFPNTAYGMRIFYAIKGARILLVLNVIFFFFILKFKLYDTGEALMSLWYLAAVSTLLWFITLPYICLHPTFNAKFNKEVIEYFSQGLLKPLHKRNQKTSQKK